jgi:hypothetical protein
MALVSGSKRVFCDYCDDYVSRRTYVRHMDEAKLKAAFKENDSEDEWNPLCVSMIWKNLKILI